MIAWTAEKRDQERRGGGDRIVYVLRMGSIADGFENGWKDG